MHGFFTFDVEKKKKGFYVNFELMQMVREAARIYLIFKWLKLTFFFKIFMENKHIFLQEFQNIKKL